MTKHKVSELEGAALDAAFGKACDLKVDVRADGCYVYDNPCGWPGACPGWYPFNVTACRDDGRDHDVARAYVKYHLARKWGDGPSQELTAAMRAYVESRFGDEVELPDAGTSSKPEPVR